MASKFIRIGGRPVFISDDEHCATDTGRVPCKKKVVVWIIQPLRPAVTRPNPDLRRGMAITPKCRVHLEELGDLAKKETLIWL